MKNILLPALALLIGAFADASAQPARALRSASESMVEAIHLTSGGGLVAVGAFTESVSPGSLLDSLRFPGRAGFVVQYDASLEVEFATMIPACLFEDRRVAETASGDLLVTVPCSMEGPPSEQERVMWEGDAPHTILLRLDAAGTLLSALHLSSAVVQGLTAVGDDAVVTGAFSDDLFVGESDEPVLEGGLEWETTFMMRLSSKGDVMWAIELEGVSSIFPSVVAATPDGGVVVTGLFTDAVVLGPDATGAGVFIEAPAASAFVARYDAGGRVVFAALLSGEDAQGTAVAVGADGMLFAAGSHGGGLSVQRVYPSVTAPVEVAEEPGLYVSGFTPEGDLAFALPVTSTGFLTARGLAVVGSRLAFVGTYDAVASFKSASSAPSLRLEWPGSPDSFLALYERDGRLHDLVRIGLHDGIQVVTSVASDGETIAVGGYFEGALDVGSGVGIPIDPPSDRAILSTGDARGPFGFVLRLTRDGELADAARAK